MEFYCSWSKWGLILLDYSGSKVRVDKHLLEVRGGEGGLGLVDPLCRHLQLVNEKLFSLRVRVQIHMSAQHVHHGSGTTATITHNTYTLPSSYRPRCLLDTFAKLLEHLLLKRLVDKIVFRRTDGKSIWLTIWSAHC